MKPFKKNTLSFIAILFVLVFPVVATAQIDGFPDSGNPDAPVDGGLSLLVTAGIGYGARQIKKQKMKNQPDS